MTTIPYPPGYEPAPKRSLEAILADIEARFAVDPTVRTIDPSEAPPAPVLKMEPKPSLDIHVPRGSMRVGLKGGCGRNAKARKKNGR